MAGIIERIQVFRRTVELCRSDPELIAAVDDSIRKQEVIWQEDTVPAEQWYCTIAKRILSPDRSFEAAMKYVREGRKVCVLNFASSVTPGGGVKSGCTAQEESLCRISTLYPAISDGKTAGAFYNRHLEMIRNGTMGRENRDDCIYTPGVKVICEDSPDCRPLPREEWYTVDVITCAAPDLRADACGRAFSPTEAELIALFEKRWRRILSVASVHEVDFLILGAFGCGAFQNPPELAAQAFDRVFPEFMHCFRTIEFAVYTLRSEARNYLAFSKISGIEEQRKEV